MKKLLLSIFVLIGFGMGSAYAQSGVQIWSERCGNCHTLQPPAWYTKLAWETVMMHMRIYAHLTDEEADAVLDFLKTGAYQAQKEVPWPRRVWARFKESAPSSTPKNEK